MKKSLKKILCTVIIAAQMMMVFPAVHAAEELVLLEANFDALENGAKTSLVSTEFNHTAYDYSAEDTKNYVEVTQLGKNGAIPDTVATAIGDSGYGKSGKSFFYNITAATATTSYTYDFKWAPPVYSTDDSGREDIQVTYEISLRAPENITDGHQKYEVKVPIYTSSSNGGPKTLISLETNNNNASKISVYDKTNNGTWTKLCDWEPGHWYNVAVTLTPGTNKLDYYLNGEHLVSGIYSDTYLFVGGRYQLVHGVSWVAPNSTYTTNMAIDDVRMYLGTPDNTYYKTAITSSAYTYEKPSSATGTVYLGSNEVSHDAFVNGITVENGGTVEVYSDEQCTTVADTVKEGDTAVVTSNNGRVLDYYKVLGKEVLLDCDLETSYGIAQNKAPSFTGKLENAGGTGAGSIGFTSGFTTYATSRVDFAGAAKDGYAYFLDVNNTTDDEAEPDVEFKFLPKMHNGKVTYEISMLAPESYDSIMPVTYIPYNDSYKALFALETDGKLGINNAYICQWIPGRWYNFAVEFTLGSGTADFYLNGDKVLDDAKIFSLGEEDIISEVGGRMRFGAKVAPGNNGVTAFDDVKVYASEYEVENNSVELISQNDDYEISEYGVVFVPENIRVNVLKNAISGDFEVYDDDSFESTATYATEGCVLAATSENGNILKYYNIVPDDTIAVTINNSATTSLSNRQTVSVGAMARSEGAKIFVAGYTVDGMLKSVQCIDADQSREKLIHVAIDTLNGDVAKVMLWDSELEPVCDAVIIKK